MGRTMHVRWQRDGSDIRYTDGLFPNGTTSSTREFRLYVQGLKRAGYQTVLEKVDQLFC